jgi:hypothetical protein
MIAKRWDKVNAIDAFLCAEAFFTASTTILEHFPNDYLLRKSKRTRHDTLVPYAANLGFSLELFFKSLYIQRTQGVTKGHSLIELYSKQLDDSERNKIDQYALAYATHDADLSNLCKSHPSLRTTIGCLQYSDRVYEYSRYAFEGPLKTDSTKMKYEVFRPAIFHIILATRRSAVEIYPTWKPFLKTPLP